MLGVIGTKVGMTRVFKDNGTSVPVTVISVAHSKIVQRKTAEKDGYYAVQVNYGSKKKVSKSLEKKFQYKIIKPKPLRKKNKIISSTLIRKLLSTGNLYKANKYLNRNWSIEGIVQKGRMMGKKIGFPTCNIELQKYVIAKLGVYAVRIYLKNRKTFLRGIANLGYRPTFNQKKILLEVNIFNFSGNLYNKNLRVDFVKFIRKEKKFKRIDQLRKQIKLDLKVAKQTY